MIRRIIMLSVATAILAGGCDLFRTRKAEAPDTGQRTWNTPRIPMDVLDNLRSALFERDAVNYMRSFDAATFRFEPDQVALSRDPYLDGWDYSKESQHVTRLFAAGTLPTDSILTVVFTSSQTTILGDSAEIATQYDLTAGVLLTGVPHHVAGSADFFLRMGSEGYWEIYRWRDTRTENQSTWSDLKSLVH